MFLSIGGEISHHEGSILSILYTCGIHGTHETRDVVVDTLFSTSGPVFNLIVAVVVVAIAIVM